MLYLIDMHDGTIGLTVAIYSGQKGLASQSFIFFYFVLTVVTLRINKNEMR